MRLHTASDAASQAAKVRCAASVHGVMSILYHMRAQARIKYALACRSDIVREEGLNGIEPVHATLLEDSDCGELKDYWHQPKRLLWSTFESLVACS